MDSGIAHIAGALGIPTVVLSPFPSSCAEEHPNSPTRFRPCGPRVRVLQPESPLPPCHPTCSFSGPHCIQQITPEDVLEAVRELLREGAESASPALTFAGESTPLR
jgi:ADP-heptose:LPS heptosyltransferase